MGRRIHSKSSNPLIYWLNAAPGYRGCGILVAFLACIGEYVSRATVMIYRPATVNVTRLSKTDKSGRSVIARCVFVISRSSAPPRAPGLDRGTVAN